MKIHPDQLKNLQDQFQKQGAGQSKQDSNFSRILEQELDPGKKAPEQISSSRLDQSSLQALHTQLKTQGTEQSSNQSEAGPMHKLESLLGQWEIYSQQLQQGNSLQQSYQTLQNINSSIQELKQSPEMEGQGPGLESMLGELEVLAVTEEIKFNRGDYL
ncbi:MAG: hypothetical protein ACQEQX_08120 [Thermodesulfobacteriota bacterium]